MKFVKFDIREIYSSMSESIFKKNISFGKESHYIPNEDVRIINHCRKSLLFKENNLGKREKRRAATT